MPHRINQAVVMVYVNVMLMVFLLELTMRNIFVTNIIQERSEDSVNSEVKTNR